MNLILKHDLDMVKIICIPKMKFLCEGHQMLYPEQTHRQTDMTENITYPNMQVVIKV